MRSCAACGNTKCKRAKPSYHAVTHESQVTKTTRYCPCSLRWSSLSALQLRVAGPKKAPTPSPSPGQRRGGQPRPEACEGCNGFFGQVQWRMTPWKVEGIGWQTGRAPTRVELRAFVDCDEAYPTNASCFSTEKATWKRFERPLISLDLLTPRSHPAPSARRPDCKCRIKRRDCHCDDSWSAHPMASSRSRLPGRQKNPNRRHTDLLPASEDLRIRYGSRWDLVGPGCYHCGATTTSTGYSGNCRPEPSSSQQETR